MKALAASSSYTLVSKLPQLPPGAPLTFETWCRPHDVDADRGAYVLDLMWARDMSLSVGVRQADANVRSWSVFVGAPDRMATVVAGEQAAPLLAADTTATQRPFRIGGTTAHTDGWTHVALVSAPTTLTLWIDGVRVANADVASDLSLTLDQIVGATWGTGRSGGGADGSDFAGARVWNTALTDEEIAAAARTYGDELEDPRLLVDLVIGAQRPWLVARAGEQDYCAVQGSISAADVVEADQLGAFPSAASEAPEPPDQPAPPAQPPVPDAPDAHVPEGEADHLLISHTLPDTVAHTGRRVVELAVAVAQTQDDDTGDTDQVAATTSKDGSPFNVLSGGDGDYQQTRTPPPANDADKAKRQVALTTALTTAQSIGFLDPGLFPLMAGSRDSYGLDRVREALAGIKAEQLAGVMASTGTELVIYPGVHGEFLWRLVPPRTSTRARPRLLLLETYTLSSFLGSYGAGRTLKTLTLLPGEKLRIQVRSYHRRTQTSNRAASVLDSSNREAESEFERLAMQEDSSTASIASSFEYHADVEAKGDATWGWGSASVDVSGGVKGNSSADRELFGKSMTNALDKHTSRSSAAREVSVTTADEVAEESWEEATSERELANINLSRTLNYVFRQMNQEYVSVLHLTDLRVAYFDGYRESKDEVPLHQLDILLARHDDIDPTAARQALADEVNALEHLTGGHGFVHVRSVDAHTRYRVNLDHRTPVPLPGGGEVSVPGAVLRTQRTVMRTDGVMVDAYMGAGNALDTYSTALQAQEARRVTLANDTTEALNALLHAAAAADPAAATAYAGLVTAATRLQGSQDAP